MSAAQPATIAESLGNELKAWLLAATTYCGENDFQFKRWAREVEKLLRVDAMAGSVLKAQLFQCTGDVDQSMYWSNNLRKLGDGRKASRLDSVLLSNCGHFSKAAELVDLLNPAERVAEFPVLFLIGAFDELLEAHNAHLDAEIPEFHHAAQIAVRCRMTLQTLHISQEHLRKVLDLAGEVLRERRMFFVGQAPVIHTHEDGLLYQLLVDVEAVDAAALTNEVIVRMVDADLDVPGLAFSFVGTRH
jgi:hypothetical protein